MSLEKSKPSDDYTVGFWFVGFLMVITYVVTIIPKPKKKGAQK